MIANHQRGHAGPIALCYVSDLNVPAHRSVFAIQRNQPGIRRNKKQIVLVHRDAPMTDVLPGLFGWV